MYKRKSKTQTLHPVSTSQGVSNSLNISKHKLQEKTISAPPVTAKTDDEDDYVSEAAALSKRVRRNSSVDKENLSTKKYFEEILEKCGLQIQYGSSPHTLTILGKEPIIIANELQTLFKKSNKSKEMIEKFMKTFEEYCKNEKYLKKALLPTQVATSSDTDIIVGIPKDSLIRILLNVDFLQGKIIDFVSEKLMEYALEEDDENNWMRLLTRPLAFLPTVNNSHKLATTLLDSIEVTAMDNQMELITVLPDILPDHEHEFVSIRLSELMKKNGELIPAIIECYGRLTLNTEKHSEVRKHLLALIQTSIAVTHIPILTQYLLNNCPQSDMLEVIQVLRKTLIDITLLLNIQDDKQLSLIMTFSTIQLAFMKSKALANTWIKVILNIKEPAAHRSIDIMILIILYTVSTHKKNVENIFKKKVTSGLFKIILIEHLYNTFLKNEIFKEYINSVIDIAPILMRMKGGTILSDFASKLFVLTFIYPDANIHNQQDVIHYLIRLTNSLYKGHVRSSLKVLTILAEEHTKLLQQHSLLLLNLLDNINELDFFDIKCIMDILCRLAFSSEYANVSTLEDDLHILIKKQLNSWKRDIQYKGIIGAVMASKHLAAIDTNDEGILHSSEKSTISISDIPNERVQQAAKLMSNVISCTSENVEAIGFAYDHLASMLVTSLQLNSYFLAWLADTITNDFQKYFIVEDTPDFLQLEGINFEMSYCINEEHEQDTKFAVNIGGLCMDNNSRVSVLYLSSLFRLMRLVHYRQNHNLTAIDAVLGCSIIMPQIHLDVGGIQDYEPKTLKIILNCYFNCVNWFREVISAFVGQKEPDLQNKVILRLKELIKLEEEFTKLMCYAPADYKPPPSYFPSRIGTDDATFAMPKRETTKAKGRGNKKNDETALNNTNMSLPSKSQTNAPSTSKIEVIDQGLIRRNYFRDLDVDVIIVLRKELSVPPVTDENTLNDEDPPNSTTLKLNELRFILEDLVVKLQEILSDPTVKSKHNSTALTTLQLIKPSDFITDCIRLFPYLTKHCHKIIECIQEILKSTDGIRDAPLLYVEGTINLKVCFSLIIEIYALTLSWSGLQHPKNNELLRDGLRNILDEEHRGLKAISTIITEISSQLLKYTEYCLYISAGINLVKLMRTILNFTSEKVVRERLVKLSENLLSMSWTDLKGNSDSGAQYNIKVDTLVKTYLLYSDIDSIQSVISWVQEECLLLKGKGDKLHTFPSIQKSNFPLLYRGLCAALVSVCKDSVDNSSNHLILWRKIVLALQSLMSIVKIQDSRSNLAAFLRRSLEILKMFLSKGITILEIKMKSQPETVVEIFRIMQQSTRFLHSLCCHSKVKSDGGLMGFVPSVRSVLEALIYRVKAALIANDCSAAFWMGNLRNKDIYGEEILSQTTQESTANTDEDGDQLPEDDDDSSDGEVQLEGEEKSHSSSEVF